jgi:dTDP-L-rhamnose 4-epimerase
MDVLVTGGAGFIGSHLVDRLAGRGHRVRVLDRLHPRAHGGPPDYLRDDVDYLWADLDGPELDDAVDGNRRGWPPASGSRRARPAGGTWSRCR